MMDTVSNINLQNSQKECIQEIANFGHTIYKDICLGTSTTVQWGQMDWLSNVVSLTFLAIIIIILLGGFYSLHKLGRDF